jgi:hypothetical protein
MDTFVTAMRHKRLRVGMPELPEKFSRESQSPAGILAEAQWFIGEYCVIDSLRL